MVTRLSKSWSKSGVGIKDRKASSSPSTPVSKPLETSTCQSFSGSSSKLSKSSNRFHICLQSTLTTNFASSTLSHYIQSTFFASLLYRDDAHAALDTLRIGEAEPGLSRHVPSRQDPEASMSPNCGESTRYSAEIYHEWPLHVRFDGSDYSVRLDSFDHGMVDNHFLRASFLLVGLA
ncbi:uncharacterized protein BDV17DRAFT_260210 [Aspergillus undulatus]|uniref:uncharacterized protein n=1 Tax=Aspergillus undulatus TaxID=1810928 RepID=UPI003CCCDE4B